MLLELLNQLQIAMVVERIEVLEKGFHKVDCFSQRKYSPPGR